MYILATIFSLLASASGLKIEDVIAHEQTSPFEEELTVEENLHGGRVLVLSDGSTWEVNPQDLSISSAWILPSPLEVKKSSDGTYPYRIINTRSQSSVLVRPLDPIKPPGLNIEHN